MAGIELQGINQMLEGLRYHLGAASHRVENKAIREGGEILAEALRSKVAVSDRSVRARERRFGKENPHMRDDIGVSKVQKKDGQKFVDVGAGDKTSWRVHFLEYGTVFMPAQPFIYPAFHETKEQIANHIADEFRKGLGEG